MAIEKDFYGTLTIDGEDFGAWDAFDGGAYDADETKYTPADGVQRTYLSNTHTTNVTLSREYIPGTDGAIVRRKGELHGKPFVFAVQDKDRDGNFQQNRPPYTGRIKMITPPAGNSDGAAVAKIAIELSCGIVT